MMRRIALLKAEQQKVQHPLSKRACEGQYGNENPNSLLVDILTNKTLHQIMAFQDKEDAISKALGFELPAAGQSTGHENSTLRWAGLNCWYIESDDNYSAIATKLESIASVTNQSDAFSVLRISGVSTAPILLKGCGIDFDISEFPIGKSAVSQVAHTRVHISRLDENDFQLLVPASYASSFWEWLELSAEEYGYKVTIK